MTPEKLRLARGMKQLERVIRRVVKDIREAEDDTPLVSIGQGTSRRDYYAGKDGRLLSPPQRGARSSAPRLYLKE